MGVHVTYKLKSPAACCVVASLLICAAVLAVSGCGGGASLPLQPGNGAGEVSRDALPEVATLDNAPPPRVVSYTSEGLHPVDPSAAVMMSDNATVDGSSLTLDSTDGELAWAIYRFGDGLPGSFFFQDYAKGLMIEAQTPESNPEAPFGYYTAVADFSADRWLFSDEVTAAGEQEPLLPAQFRPVTSAQTIYLAVIVYGGAAARLDAVTGDFYLTGRTIDQLDSRFPEYDLAGRPVRFTLIAEDAQGYYCFSFNKQATLTADPGVVILEHPQFVEGVGHGTVQLPGPGSYEVFLEDASPALDGSVGVCQVYESNLPVCEILIDEADYRDLRLNPYGDEYKPCVFRINGQEFAVAETRFRGGDARDFPKKSWKVKLPEDAGWIDGEWGYSSREVFNFNAEYTDPTLIRDKLGYEVYAMLGVPAPRTRFVHLRVNDEYYGVMLDVENPRKNWLSQMGFDNDGVLYSANDNRFQTLAAPELYDGPFTKQTREEEPFDDLHSLISTVNNLAPHNVYIGLKALIKMNLYRKYMVGNALISQQRNLRHNYLLYYDDDDSMEWLVIPWDNDFTWGRQLVGIDKFFDFSLMYDSPIDWGDWNKYPDGNNLMTIYLNDELFFDEYKQELADSLDTVFTEEIWNQRITELKDLIYPDMLADPNKLMPSEDYEGFILDLRDYISGRRSYLLQVLAQ
jgi:spore coat protein H